MPHTCEPSNSDCYSILCLRLARFNDMQTKRDQRNAEDTLSLNRPSIVERDFRDLKSEERVDALIIIKDRYKNEIYVSPERLSCIIFEVIAIELQRYFKRTFIGKWQEVLATHMGTCTSSSMDITERRPRSENTMRMNITAWFLQNCYKSVPCAS